MPAARQAVVVGAGIGGLVWAYEAASRGWDVSVLEATDRPGGAIRRVMVGGVAVEVGAEAFAVARPTVLELLAELGLADQVVRPATHQAHLFTRNGLVPLPTGFLGIPVDLDDVARLLGAPAAAEAARRDAVPVDAAAPLPATLGTLVRQRLGDAVATQLVDPVVAGVHATPADEAELASVAPPLAEALRHHGGLVAAARALRGPLGPAGAPVATLDGGLSGLVDALVARLDHLGARLRTSTAATRLARRPGGWRVTTTTGDLDAEVVAIALPPGDAATLLGTNRVGGHSAASEAEASDASDTTEHDGLDPIARALRQLQPTPVTVVTLLVDAPTLSAAGAPVGSGVLVAPDVLGVEAKAMTHASAKWAHVAESLPAGHHLFRLSYGGRERGGQPVTAPPDLDDGVLIRTALADAERLLGAAAGPLALTAAHVTRWRRGLVRPRVGRRAAIDAIDAALHALPDVAMVGGAVAGNGLLGVVARSRTEAARTLG